MAVATPTVATAFDARRPTSSGVDRHGVRRAVVRTSSSSAMRAPRSAGMFKGPPRSTQVRRDPRRPERVDDGSPAAARRLIMASTTRRVNGLPVSVDALGTAPPRPSSRRLPGLPPGPGVAIPERTTRRAKARRTGHRRPRASPSAACLVVSDPVAGSYRRTCGCGCRCTAAGFRERVASQHPAQHR